MTNSFPDAGVRTCRVTLSRLCLSFSPTCHSRSARHRPLCQCNASHIYNVTCDAHIQRPVVQHNSRLSRSTVCSICSQTTDLIPRTQALGFGTQLLRDQGHLEVEILKAIPRYRTHRTRAPWWNQTQYSLIVMNPFTKQVAAVRIRTLKYYPVCYTFCN